LYFSVVLQISRISS